MNYIKKNVCLQTLTSRLCCQELFHRLLAFLLTQRLSGKYDRIINQSITLIGLQFKNKTACYDYILFNMSMNGMNGVLGHDSVLDRGPG